MRCLNGFAHTAFGLLLGAIPVTVLHPGDDGSNNHTHAAFSGKVLFQNEFYGQLAAAEYPKITVRAKSP